jgi:nanoRNase/pAp phosphatase (c-di-AMP/oligoRNAs hydrolase)
MLIAQSVERASLVLFEGHTVYAVNEGNGRIRSEVAHALYIKRPPFSIVWSWDNNVIHISLRSEKNGFDVSRIAKKYGGGGHTQAAGFLLPASKPFPWKSVKISLKRV